MMVSPSSSSLVGQGPWRYLGEDSQCLFLPSLGLSASWQGARESTSYPFASCASVSPRALGELLPGTGVTLAGPVGKGPMVAAGVLE